MDKRSGLWKYLNESCFSGSSRTKRATWTVYHHTVLVRYVDEAWTGTATSWPTALPPPVRIVVFRLDCAEDMRDDRSVIVQEAKPNGPELPL